LTGSEKTIRNIPETLGENYSKTVKEKTCVARGNSWNPRRETVRTLSFFSLAGHGDEGDGEESGVLKTRVGAPDQHQALGVLRAQGQDQPPAEGELIQERLRKGSRSAVPVW